MTDDELIETAAGQNRSAVKMGRAAWLGFLALSVIVAAVVWQKRK